MNELNLLDKKITKAYQENDLKQIEECSHLLMEEFIDAFVASNKAFYNEFVSIKEKVESHLNKGHKVELKQVVGIKELSSLFKSDLNNYCVCFLNNQENILVLNLYKTIFQNKQ